MGVALAGGGGGIAARLYGPGPFPGDGGPVVLLRVLHLRGLLPVLRLLLGRPAVLPHLPDAVRGPPAGSPLSAGP
ncbi:MAG: hypothetical protein QXG65_05005, partial [Thermoplasmata archaeon]